MEDLQVTSWKRFGHDRLYVNLPDGTSIAWADRRTGDITLVHPTYRDAVADALARRDPVAAEETSVTVGRPPLPPLTPDNDLAANRPGAALSALLDKSGPTPVQRTLALALRRRPHWDPWRTGLAGERRVGAELSRLSRHGWRVLHSVPLPREVDIDHLLIGPGGIFTITTEHHPGKAVWVDDDTIRFDNGDPRPHALKNRAAADRVRQVLESHCDFSVPIHPMVIFVGVTTLDVVATQLNIRVYQERQVAALSPLSGALTAHQVSRAYATSRDRRAWLDA